MGNDKERPSYEDEIQSTLLDMAKVERKARQLVDRFYIDNDQATVCNIISLIYDKGNPKNREFLDEFKEKMEKGDLSLKEIARYQDLYEQHKILLVK